MQKREGKGGVKLGGSKESEDCRAAATKTEGGEAIRAFFPAKRANRRREVRTVGGGRGKKGLPLRRREQGKKTSSSIKAL